MDEATPLSRPMNPKPRKYVATDKTVSYQVHFRRRENGVSKHTTRTFDTNREALDFCRDISDSQDVEWALKRLAEKDKPITRGPSLDDVYHQFAAWNAGRVKSSRTGEEYAGQWAVIAPAIGAHRPVADVTEDDVQRWVDDMVAGKTGARTVNGKLTPLSPKTIANRHGLLHSVFKYAAARGQRYIATNPCAETELPKRRKGMPKGLRVGEWQALHAALCQIDPDCADLVFALYASGARFGEITAIRTWSVEDDGRHVTLVIDHVNRRMAGGRYEIVEDTKSEAGFRKVRLGAASSDMIRRRLNNTTPGELVFTNRHGRVWLHSTAYLAWNQAVKLANLSRRPTVHWLRHTHVQELIDLGVPMSEIQARVGHESFQTTSDTYNRLRRGIRDDILDTLDGPVQPPQIASAAIVAGELA